MNLNNNAFCNYSILINNSEIITNWQTSKTYNHILAHKLNAKTNNEYKEKLISNTDIINAEEKLLNCAKDTSVNHNMFVNDIMNEMYKNITVKPFYSYEYYNIDNMNNNTNIKSFHPY